METLSQLHKRAEDLLAIPEDRWPPGMNDTMLQKLLRITTSEEEFAKALSGMPGEYMQKVVYVLLVHGTGAYDKLKEY